MAPERANDSLAGRTAVVTGASRGIGLATARRLASAGARVVMLARASEKLSAAAATIGERALSLACDVTDRVAVEQVAAEIASRLGGGPHILVNNAGLFQLARVSATTPELFADMLDTNLVAPFLFLHAFLPAMQAHGDGHIVTVGSVADRTTFPENGAYAASKFGLRALHEVLRAELRGTGVRATLVSPGPVDTSLWDSVRSEAREGIASRAAMLSADAVADAIFFAVTRPADVNVDEMRLGRA